MPPIDAAIRLFRYVVFFIRRLIRYHFTAAATPLFATMFHDVAADMPPLLLCAPDALRFI